jgi:hypothetical protein
LEIHVRRHHHLHFVQGAFFLYPDPASSWPTAMPSYANTPTGGRNTFIGALQNDLSHHFSGK